MDFYALILAFGIFGAIQGVKLGQGTQAILAAILQILPAWARVAVRQKRKFRIFIEEIPMKEQLLKWINQALVADFFLVLFAFFWLAIAVAGHLLHLPLGLDLWYKLWQPVFTPAIGILIAGSLISGLTSWISKRFNSQQMN